MSEQKADHVADAERRLNDATSGMWEITVDPENRDTATFGRYLTNGDMVQIAYSRLDTRRLLRTIATLRAELAKHDDTAKLLAAYAEQHGQSWRDADERKGLHARPSSTSGDVILKLVELGEMELIHNDNAWGICAVWTEET